MRGTSDDGRSGVHHKIGRGRKVSSSDKLAEGGRKRSNPKWQATHDSRRPRGGEGGYT